MCKSDDGKTNLALEGTGWNVSPQFLPVLCGDTNWCLGMCLFFSHVWILDMQLYKYSVPFHPHDNIRRQTEILFSCFF